MISSFKSNLDDLSEKQIYHYMGINRAAANEELRDLVECLQPQFLKTVNCNACFLNVPVCIAGDTVDLDVFTVNSSHLARNLRGCERAILFAATLGMTVEQQRRRASVISPLQALVLDAMGNTGIEAFCDKLCGEIALIEAEYKLRPRFSPGYGDFPLEMQKEILHVLDAQRKIGVSISEGLLMIPQKSVTAVIGLSKTGCEKAVPMCDNCDELNCEFRL